MPLLDHFHPPLHPSRPWESFHARWANSIADALQRMLPPRYVSEIQIHLGSRVEADVAEFERPPEPDEASPNGAGGMALQTWAPPAPPLTMAAAFPDEIEVQVRDMLNDARLVAVVELVSPGNLDRADARRGFAGKCAAYLQNCTLRDFLQHEIAVFRGISRVGGFLGGFAEPPKRAIIARTPHFLGGFRRSSVRKSRKVQFKRASA